MSQQIVAQAKADLLAAGRDLSGTDGAFLIVMEAASRIPSAGVVDKPQGNHAAFEGGSYSVDGIMFQDGRFFDCLGDGGGANTPQWNQGDNIDASRWRPAKSVLGASPQTPQHPGEPVQQAFDPFVRTFIYAAANSMYVGHEELRMLGTELGVMDGDGQPITGERPLARIQRQLTELASAQTSTGGVSIDPAMITALTPVLLPIFTQVFAAWVKTQKAASITVTPIAKVTPKK